MRYWALGILTVLVVVLETTAIPYISIGGIGPDIVGSLVTLVSMLSGREMGLFVALVGGVLEDVSSGQFLGLFVLVRGVVACLAGMAYQKVFQEWVLVPVILVFGAAVAGGILQVFLLASFGVPFESCPNGSKYSGVSGSIFSSPVTYCYAYNLYSGCLCQLCFGAPEVFTTLIGKIDIIF